MAILSKAICRVNVILIKLPMTFFTELKQIIPQFLRNHKRPRIAKTILREKQQQQSRRHISPRLQTILQSYSNQNSVVLVQKQTQDQWNTIENPEINPHTYSKLIFDKGGKNIKWKKDTIFSKWCWESWTAACKSMKLEHTLTPCTKINSKWLKDLMIKNFKRKMCF